MNTILRNIPFSPPDMTTSEVSEVSEALRSGWITTGPRTKAFERQLSNYCHTGTTVCLNSATACMELALRVLGVGPGDEVITSAYTYTATASVTCHVGAKVVLVDTAPDSYEMDYDKLDDEWLYRQFQLLSLHGQSKDALAKTQLGAWEYDIVAPNFKCNMTDIMAGIGLAQLKRYPEMLYRRRQLIGHYDEALKGYDVRLLNHYGSDHASSGHLYLVRLVGKDVDERNDVIVRMAERGIACNVHYKPLPMMTAYKTLGFDIADYPNAYNQYRNEVTLPLHTRLSDDDAEYVIRNFLEIIH